MTEAAGAEASAGGGAGEGAPPAIVADLLRFEGEGAATSFQIRDGIPCYVNAFWTAAQRRSHPLHEISYRACFKAELPGFLISRLTRPGDLVADPFMGRGTTPIQAALMGRRAAGSDVNPLSILLARPRLRPMTADRVERALAGIDWARGQVARDDLLAFYHAQTLAQIEALRLWLADRAPLADPDPDPVADWIRMVAINRLSGHSPGFFSGRSMPPNQAVSVETQRRINARLGLSPPVRDVAGLILRKTRSLLRGGSALAAPGGELAVGPASDLRHLAPGSVGLTVTSPPFLDIVNYAADNWLRLWFAGIDPEAVAIDRHRTAEGWAAMMRRVLDEQARVLRPGGHLAIEVGEVRGGKVVLERLIWEAAEGLPFDRLGVMVNAQAFTKTAHCWGIDNGAKGTNSNRIVLMRRR